MESESQRILLINAPMTDLFTAYPGVFFVAGHLRNLGHQVVVEDLSLKFGLKVFSREGLLRIAHKLREKFAEETSPPGVAHFLKFQEDYLSVIDLAVRHLQGREPAMSYRICQGNVYPPSPDHRQWIHESQVLGKLKEAEGDHGSEIFGRFGFHDRARYLSSAFLQDIVGIVNQGIDPLFGIANYGVFKREAKYWPDVHANDWKGRLEETGSLCVQMMEELATEAVLNHQPDLVGISASFNHTAFGALRMARAIKKISKSPIVLGGHYANTTLRSLTSPWIFNYVDYVTLDNGERPMERLVEYLRGGCPQESLVRTYVFKDQKILFQDDQTVKDVPQASPGIPSYLGINSQDYPQFIYSLGSVKHILQSTFTSKLKLSHGCYWGKCTFCDTKLDYIGNYDPYTVDQVFQEMKRLIEETGSRAFHFVDEALPPKLVRQLCEKILAEKLNVMWWGYVRLDPGFTPDLTKLMAAAGCVHVQAGVETPVPRLLKLMKKGTTLEQIVQISHNFSQAGILVETCLMYGFPTQTVQEVVDGLEFVRQLFLNGCIQLGGWSRFYLSPHSTIVDHVDKLGLKVDWENADLLNWEFPFEEEKPVNFDVLERGLTTAMGNFALGAGLDRPAKSWFAGQTIPNAQLPENFVKNILESRETKPQEVVV